MSVFSPLVVIPSWALAAVVVSSLVACGDDAIVAGTDADGEVLIIDTAGGDTFTADTAPPIDTAPPADTTPADTTPADTTPADTRPADTTPADTTPADTTPADTTPADTTPADTTPADTTPADTTPADTTPADTTPADTTPADTTPADTAPADTGPQQCPDEALETYVGYSTIFRQENFGGTGNDVKFLSDMCGDEPDSNEKVYYFDLFETMEIYAETDCGWDCELVLTRDGCTDSHVMACEASIGEEAFGGQYVAGAYRLFVEGDNPEDPAPYDIMINLNYTGGQQICDAELVDLTNAANCQDPFAGSPRYETTFSGSTSPADYDDFFVQDVGACTHDGSHVGGAPDKVYEFTLGGERDVEITLSPSFDALLYVTSAPCGARASVVDCSDDSIGSNEELALTLGAGTWYIVVDGFGEETFSENAWGTFDVEVLVFDDACNQ